MNSLTTWYVVCGAGRIPEGQGSYASESAAQDVMRLHASACPGEHRVASWTPEYPPGECTCWPPVPWVQYDANGHARWCGQCGGRLG